MRASLVTGSKGYIARLVSTSSKNEASVCFYIRFRVSAAADSGSLQICKQISFGGITFPPDCSIWSSVGHESFGEWQSVQVSLSPAYMQYRLVLQAVRGSAFGHVDVDSIHRLDGDCLWDMGDRGGQRQIGFLTPSSTTRLYRGRAPRQSVWQFYVLPHMRQSWETMTFVSAGHIILTPTQPVGSGWPQRDSNPGPPHQESRALPTELTRPRQRQKQRDSEWDIKKMNWQSWERDGEILYHGDTNLNHAL